MAATGVYMREAQTKQLMTVSFVDRKVRETTPSPMSHPTGGRQRTCGWRRGGCAARSEERDRKERLGQMPISSQGGCVMLQ
jgi:hypothetical protein